MAKEHSIEIDVSLGTDGIDRDFSDMERKAKNGVKGVVRAVDQITTAMSETGAGAKEAGQDYEKAAEGMEKSAKETIKPTAELQESVEETSDSTEKLKESEKELGKQSRETGKDQEELGDKTDDTREKVDKSRESFLSWGDVAKTAVKGVTVVAGTLFTAMGAGAGAATKFGTEYKQASNTIQATTGSTKKEMEGLSETMKNVYANNFGEDMNEVGEAVANVKKYLGGTDKDIQKATETAFAFRDTFGYEIPESTRAASAIMKHFGGDAEHAYDLMAKGAQNGLDFSGELLDNIDEYSVQFAKAGLSAENMFNIMAAGADAGAWNLDKIGDAAKELNIRLVDGSDTTKEGLKAIGLNADDVAKKMAKGGDTAKETYAKVVNGLAKMNNKQKQNIAGVNLFGTMWEDLGPEVIAQLATMEGAYDNVKGTMDKINRVKYDDAESALEALKRKTEVSLLLPISDDILPAISDATNASMGYIDDLANAYDSNGINGLVEKAGDIFVDIATNAAEEAPRMVEIAGDFVEQLVTGFKKNNKRLAKAGADAVKAIAGAAVKMLPKELQEPVEDAVDDMVDSLTGGGMKNGLKTFGTMFGNGFKVVTNVTKTVLPPFVKIVDKAADNMDVLIPLVVAGATAFKIYGTAVTLVTTETTLASAATKAFNSVLNLNPVALLVTGVVAAGAALVAYCLATDNSAEATFHLSEEEQVLTDHVNEQKESYERLRDERDKQFENITAEFSHTQELADELQTIVDKNGKIKKGYEERAAVIVGLLNDALGTEIKITDGVIQNYDKLKDSIDQVIQIKKAEAMQSAMEPEYIEAVQKQDAAARTYSETQKQLKRTTDELKDAQRKQQEIQNKIDNAPTIASLIDYWEEMEVATDKVKGLEDEQKHWRGELATAEQSCLEYATAIDTYMELGAAAASGNVKKINDAILLATNHFITAEHGTKKSLEKQVENMKDNYIEMRRAIKDGAPGVTQESVDNAKRLVEMSEAELKKFNDKARKQANDGISTYAEGMLEKEPEVKTAAASISKAATGELNVDTKMYGNYFATGFSEGIKSKVHLVVDSAAVMAQKALASVQRTIQSRSPAKKTDKLGGYFGEGFANGIVRLTTDAVEAAGEMGKKAVQELRSQMEPVTMDFDVAAMTRRVETVVDTRISSYAEPQYTSLDDGEKNDDFKKKADYLISGFRRVVKDQGGTVIEWKGREVARMYKEVLE